LSFFQLSWVARFKDNELVLVLSGFGFNVLCEAADEDGQNTTFLGWMARSVVPGLRILEHFAPTIILATDALFLLVALAVVVCHFVMAMVAGT
jgi:hypothetical protein